MTSDVPVRRGTQRRLSQRAPHHAVTAQRRQPVGLQPVRDDLDGQLLVNLAEPDQHADLQRQTRRTLDVNKACTFTRPHADLGE